jgi:predicted TIM-barrel fold metal-dependent hydrolase
MNYSAAQGLTLIIDAHVHVFDHTSEGLGQVPFTAEALLAEMAGPYRVLDREACVDRAIVQPHPSDTLRTPDVVEQHAYVTRSMRAHPDRLVGCMMLDPHHDAGGNVEALRHLAASGYGAIKLHPTMHAYHLEAVTDRLAPVIEAGTELGMVVIVHTGDPPFAEPVQALDLIEHHPATNFVLAHLGTQQVSYAHQAIYLARHHPNVFVEAGWGTLPRLKDAVSVLGPERVLHATDCPILEMGSQLRLLDVLRTPPPIGLGLATQDEALLFGGNAARLLGLPDDN